MAELMPEGQYTGNVLSAEFGSSSGGHLQMVIKFSLGEGTTRTVYLTMNENTMGTKEDGTPRICQQQLDTLGYNGDDPPTFSNGENVQLYMKHDEYNGKIRERWNVSSGFALTPATPDQINRFKSQWRALKGAGPKPATRATAPTTAPTRTAPTTAPTRTAPARPAPKPAAGLDDYSKYNTAESVFKLWAGIQEKAKKPMTDDAWWAFIDSVMKGKSDAEFTAEDWSKCAAAADLPF